MLDSNNYRDCNDYLASATKLEATRAVDVATDYRLVLQARRNRVRFHDRLGTNQRCRTSLAFVARRLVVPLALISVSAMSIALLATGILLARRSRIGGLLGLGLTLYPFAFAIGERRSVASLELGVAGLTVVALLIVWGELECKHPT